MREILFKAKRKDNGEWAEGFYFCMVHDDGSHVHHFIMPLGVDLSLGTPIEKIQVEIDAETLCQYTGLTDKNGNKIWENDIVKCYADTDDLGNYLYFFYKVIWHELYHCWWLSDIHTLEDEYLHQYNPSDIEVIGNIFDNPELLGE